MATPDAAYRSFRGLRNDTTPERFEPGDMAEAVNVDLDPTGRLLRRQGHSAPVYAGDVHSLAAFGDVALFVEGDTLKRLWPDWTATILAAGLTPGEPMRYAEGLGRIFYSNGQQRGIVENGRARSWGIAPPLSRALAVNTTGKLHPGTYQFVLTYVRDDGQESGAGVAGLVQVSDGGIAFAALPISSNPDVVAKRIYLSSANGDVLYFAQELPNAYTTTTVTEADLQIPISTQFMSQPPAGQALAVAFGCVWVAAGNLLYRSKVFGPELFDPRDALVFPAPVRLLIVTEPALIVATENAHYRLTGNAEAVSMTRVADYGGIADSVVHVPFDLTRTADGEGPAAYWLSTEGICLATPDGNINNLTAPRYRFDAPSRAPATLTFARGFPQYLVSLID